MRAAVISAVCAAVVLVSASASAVSRVVALADGAVTAEPSFEILSRTPDGLTLRFDLQALEVEDIEIEGRTFQMVSIPGGGVAGEVGQAAIPTVTRLISIPARSGVTVRVVDSETERLDGYTILPMQADSDEVREFAIDEAFYAADTFGERPLVAAGAPAMLRDLRVVPLTLAPLRYNPARRAIDVSRSVTVQVEFAGQDLRNILEITRAVIPSSFDRLYRSLVLNYEGPRAGQTVGVGGYLMICPNMASVVRAVQPLINWRTQMGYTTELATTADVGGSTTTAIKNYIQDAYNTWDVPLEYVVLVGDGASSSILLPTYDDPWYGGEGDHPYTTLEGGDILSDVHIGRISVVDTLNLKYIVNKIVDYEVSPYTHNTQWFKSACLIGDPTTSGITCVHVMEWMKHRLAQLGYTGIDEIYSEPFVSGFQNSVNDGVSVMAYRGYWHMSYIDNSVIDGLSNWSMTPFAVCLTCDTGSFASGTSYMETFLRTGSLGLTKGAVGAIGTATLSTSTRFNNIMMFGIWQSVLYDGVPELGAALTRGKLEMYRHFYEEQPSYAEIYAYWNNLMGDPATPCWTAVPSDFVVSHPSTIPVHSTSMSVTVTDFGTSDPVPGALVCFRKEGETHATGFTDDAGHVELAIDVPTTGAVQVTVTKWNYRPFARETSVVDESDNVALNAYQVDDDGSGTSSGNGDGLASPGESIEVPVELKNWGTSTAHNVTAVMRSEDPFVTITDSVETYGDIIQNGAEWSPDDFDVLIHGGCPNGRGLQLGVDITATEGTWHALVELTAAAPEYAYSSHTWYDVGGALDPGESGEVSIAVTNDGDLDAQGVTGTLISLSQHLAVTDGAGTYGTIAKGATVGNTSDRFGVSASAACYPGYVATCLLVLETSGGARDTVVVGLKIGTAATTDPLGPDGYGYWAFDNTDTDYPEAPVYSWVEIAGNYGGSGTDVGLNDNGFEQDAHVTVDLPFAFAYYGSTFTQVTICSNGWMAMGDCDDNQCWNSCIPGAAGPNAMIAPFWDDLYQPSGAEVWKYYDAANHRFIVEWSRLRNEYADATEVFEVILLDPTEYPTATGDGQILFQYNTVTNNDGTHAYATVGIENLDHSDGIEYTFWNNYPGAAATLAAGRAILFVPVVAQDLGYIGGDVTNLTGGGTPVSGAEVRLLEAGRSLFTTQDGGYFGPVAVDTYTVVVFHPSFAPDTAYSVAVAKDETTTVNFSIVDIAGPAITNTTQYLMTDDTVGPYEITTHIYDYSGIDEKAFYYRVNLGPPQPLTLSPLGDDDYLAQIPGQPHNSRIDYYLYAKDTPGYETEDPPGAPGDTTYVFHVVPVDVVLDDDMETVGGWTVGAPDDDATTGIWERVDPNATYYDAIMVQPEDDHTTAPGVNCYITGQSAVGADQGANDVDGGKTTFISAVLDLSGYASATLGYYRWYTNDTGNAPGQDYWQVGVTDDGSFWESLEYTNQSDRTWSYHQFDLEDYIDLTDQVQIRFVGEDAGSGSIVEAGVDDVTVVAFSLPSDTQAPSVTVLDPNGGEELVSGGAPYVMSWHVEDDQGIRTTHILLSTDGGASYPDTIAKGVLDSTYAWTVPEVDEPACRIRVVCLDGASNQGADVSDSDFAISTGTSVPLEEGEAPREVFLRQNRPNPFNPVTEIVFGLPKPMSVRLRVFNVEGRLVQTLADGPYPAGQHAARWFGRDGNGVAASSGIYFYRLETPDRVLTQKMLLLK